MPMRVVAFSVAALICCGQCAWIGFPCMANPEACLNGGSCVAATDHYPEHCNCTVEYVGHDCGMYQGLLPGLYL